MKRVRIVSDGMTTMGTRVLDADTGEDIGLRVTKIVLVGKVGDRWRCRLDVLIDGLDVEAEVGPTDVAADLETSPMEPPPPPRKLDPDPPLGRKP